MEKVRNIVSGIWGATCPSKLVSTGKLTLNLKTVIGYFILLILLFFLICLLPLLMLIIKIITAWGKRGLPFLKTVSSLIFPPILGSLWSRKWWQIYLLYRDPLGKWKFGISSPEGKVLIQGLTEFYPYVPFSNCFFYFLINILKYFS